MKVSVRKVVACKEGDLSKKIRFVVDSLYYHDKESGISLGFVIEDGYERNPEFTIVHPSMSIELDGIKYFFDEDSKYFNSNKVASKRAIGFCLVDELQKFPKKINLYILKKRGGPLQISKYNSALNQEDIKLGIVEDLNINFPFAVGQRFDEFVPGYPGNFIIDKIEFYDNVIELRNAFLAEYLLMQNEKLANKREDGKHNGSRGTR